MGRRARVAALAAGLAVTVLAAVALMWWRPWADPASPPWWGCGDLTREPIDPRSLQRWLPGQPEPIYDDPAPTSGPHAETQLEGWQDAPLPKPLQVGILERGRVLVQFRPDTPPSIQAAVRATVEGPAAIRGAVAAPNVQLADPVVVTSWRTRMRCSRVDRSAIGEFAARVVPPAAVLSP